MLIVVALFVLVSRSETVEAELLRKPAQAQLRAAGAAAAPKTSHQAPELGLVPQCAEEQHDAIAWMGT